MKKIYINPKMKVVGTKPTRLLSGSNPKYTGTTNSTSGNLAPRMGGDDDDFDFEE